MRATNLIDAHSSRVQLTSSTSLDAVLIAFFIHEEPTPLDDAALRDDSSRGAPTEGAGRRLQSARQRGGVSLRQGRSRLVVDRGILDIFITVRHT